MSYNSDYRTGTYVYTPPYVPVTPPVVVIPPVVNPYPSYPSRRPVPPPVDVYVPGRVTDIHTSRRGNLVIDGTQGRQTVITQDGRVLNERRHR